EPAELRGRHVRGGHRVVRKRAAVDVYAGHQRFEYSLRQVIADFRHGVANIRHRAIDGRADFELQGDVDLALDDEGGDIAHIADARYGPLHLLGDLRLHFRGRRAGLGNIDVDDGKGNVRIQIDRHADERHHTEKEQHHEQNDRRDRMANGPGGDISHDSRTAGGAQDRIDQFTLLEERACGRDDLLLAADALGNGHPVTHHSRYAHGTALDLALRVHDHDVAALVVAEHGRLRQNLPIGVAHGHFGARESAGPQIWVRGQRHPSHPKAGLWIYDGPEKPDVALEALGQAGQPHIDRLADLQQRQGLLGHLTTQFAFAVLGQTEQGIPAGSGRLPHFDVAGQYDSIGRCANPRA